MNLKQLLHILIGLVWILVGVYLAYIWFEDFLIVIKGALPWVFAGIGLLWALIGYLLSEDIEEDLDLDEENLEDEEENEKEENKEKK
jgi:hypothetical protein